MKLDTLEKLLVPELKDLYSAETQLLEALPKMAEASHHPELREAFKTHLRETKTQVTRIESIFKGWTYSPGGHRCLAMEALIEKGAGMIKADAEPEVRDAGLIAAAQRVEHYEIAAYGTAAALATKLGMHGTAATLRETLEEEGKTDRDDHAWAAGRLQLNVRNMGGRPDTESGAWGSFTKTLQSTANLFGENSALALIEQGEKHGQNDYEDALADDEVMADRKRMIRGELLPKIEGHLGTLEQIGKQ